MQEICRKKKIIKLVWPVISIANFHHLYRMTTYPGLWLLDIKQVYKIKLIPPIVSSFLSSLKFFFYIFHFLPFTID
jgi:hypothetical protein